jgi:hypothetical protein
MDAAIFMELIIIALALALVLAVMGAGTEQRVTETDLFLARLKDDRQGAS